MVKLKEAGQRPRYEPLEEVTVAGAEDGEIVVRDADGRAYVRAEAEDPFTFRVAGKPGIQRIEWRDSGGHLRGDASFRVECGTRLEESEGRFGELLETLYWTMVGWHGETDTFRIDHKVYKFFVRWLRDHVHTLKGMKYFYPDLKTAIELYADTQREDGMVFDKIGNDPGQVRPTHRDHWFGPGGFITKINDGRDRMERIPVENDVEYLFVEGLYYTWKATADDRWMAGLLDNAMRAFEYSTSDEYRWSEKFGLLKRGFTIDTWDFQAEEDAEITGYSMVVDPQKTRFGVMHGDNTGFMAGCRYLAEMLTAAGRQEEAQKYARLADEIKERLDRVAWNGEFYTHHVPEDPEVERDLGVDQSKQVSLSNAYALNRGIDHEQCVEIIETYRRIRREMPDSSPGEFYQIYPPYERGFGGHGSMWEYMNGGVTSIVAGELAHGALEHGFEAYGADILRRVLGWAKDHRDYLHCTYKGKMPQAPERSFTTLDLREQANADLAGEGAEGVPGWSGEGGNDLASLPTGRRDFEGVPFDVIDPAQNGRRAVVAMSCREGYYDECTIPVGRRAASVYCLHTAGGDNPIGQLEVHYADGGTATEYIMKGRNVNGWWLPHTPPSGRHSKEVCRVAWWGANAVFPNVGCYVYGWDNPEPEREIEDIVLRASRNGAFWPVMGITLCDAEVFFPPDDLSFGIPDNWGAAAVLYALVEGLAGVKDTGVAFDRALLAPRWTAAGVDRAEVAIAYRASGGYVRYDYALSEAADEARFDVAVSGEELAFEFLLPEGAEPDAVAVDGKPAEFSVKRVEDSRYVCLDLKGPAAHTVEIGMS